MADKFAEKWGVKGDATVKFGLKGVGQTALIVSTMILALVKGEDGVKAYGYAWVATISALVFNIFFTKEIDGMNMKREPQYFYMILGYQKR